LVRITGISEPYRGTNLHSIWDSQLGGRPDDLGDIVIALDTISHIPNLSLDDLKSDTTPKEWAQQSARVAFETAYLSGTLAQGKLQNPVSLPADYLDKTKVVANKRAALAGFRLADALKDLTVVAPSKESTVA